LLSRNTRAILSEIYFLDVRELEKRESHERLEVLKEWGGQQKNQYD
jgi:hypothetical protein